MEKNKKPFYKKWWVWIIAIIIVGAIAGTGEENESETANVNSQQESTVVDSVENKEEAVDSVVEPEAKVEEENVVEEVADVPSEYKSALKKAQTYSDMMNMSKAGLYDQLTSEYGEKFSAEAAQYAIDNLEVDYNENALKKAQVYQETMAMSPAAIYDQLISDYGEKFTAEEAQYAIDNLE